MSDEPKIKVPRAEIEKIIHETLESGKYATHADLDRIKGGGQGRDADPHTHKPEEFMPAYVKQYKCPDGNCGRIHENPNFKHADTYCESCGHAIGTVEDAKKVEKCPSCGSTGPAMFVSRWKGK